MAGRALNFHRLTGRAVIRDSHEEHRASTTLELFFDLAIVVAVGRAAASLHHELGAGEVSRGVVGFLLLFFGVWLAWLNFTWFATAHDSDDVPFRLLTFVQIAGALIFAAGVNRAIVEENFAVGVAGYVLMRVGLIGNWLRVARDVPQMRGRALRYAGGLAALQVLWVAFLSLPRGARVPAFIALGCVELLVPVLAERAAGAATFHPGHIEERYGLLTIIVLGESMISSTAGFQEAFDAGGLTAGLLTVGICGLVLAFCSWWLYFDHPGHLAPTLTTAFRWGYGHVLIFASLAAVGAGVHVAIEATAEEPHGEPRTAALAIAIPVAGFLVGLVVIMLINRARVSEPRIFPKLIGAAAVVIVGATASVPVTAVVCAAVTTVLAGWMVLAGDRPAEESWVAPTV